jgi:hypothetical protein
VRPLVDLKCVMQRQSRGSSATQRPSGSDLAELRLSPSPLARPEVAAKLEVTERFLGLAREEVDVDGGVPPARSGRGCARFD